MYSPLSSPFTQNLSAIEQTIQAIKPNRLGLFNPTVNRSATQTQQLLSDLGYNE
jgi:hypothetical protein